MKPLKDGIRSLVKIDFQNHVHKTFRGTGAKERFRNEIAVLRALQERGCAHVPRLIEADHATLTLVTTNCGSPAEGISRGKADALFSELERLHGIRHKDPEPRNVTYCPDLGRFCLIDFELAEILPLPEKTAIDPGASAPGDVWRVSWCAASLQGKTHTANDDAWLALEVSSQGAITLPPEGEILLDPNHLVLAVSDGMGGHSAGELASRLVLSWIRRHAAGLHADLAANPGNPAPLAELIQSAHLGLTHLASEDPALSDMGATLTLAWITPGHLHLAHAGDSRLYLSTGSGETSQLSEDHTFAWKQWKRGQLSEFQYRQHSRRNSLYEVLGPSHQRPSPQFLPRPLGNNDRLLLCSDGLIDGLWERHIAEILPSSQSPGIREASASFLTRSYDADGKDDTTLLLAEFQHL